MRLHGAAETAGCGRWARDAGLTIATLVGTPIATFLGQLMSWRAAFLMVAAIGALTVALIAVYLPKDEVAEGASIRRELSAFGRFQVWLSFAVAAVGFGGMFAIFSYIAKTVTDTAGLSASMVAVCWHSSASA